MTRAVKNLFLREMKLYSVHVCKNESRISVRNATNYIKDKQFSTVQVDNDVVVTRIK